MDEYIKAIKLELNYYVKCVAVALVVVGSVITGGFYMVWVKKHGRKNQAEV